MTAGAWTDEQWDIFCGLVEEAWPGDFDDHTARNWRVLLDGLGPDAATTGLRRLLLEGHRFRPSVSELLAAALHDPSQPTFDELLTLLYGPRGVFAARPERTTYAHDGERRSLLRGAALQRASELHPLVHAFVARRDLDRLRNLRVDDPEWGEKRLADLRRDWDQHVETWDGRQIAALATGADARLQLTRLDPLAALGLGTSAHPELPEGGS